MKRWFRTDSSALFACVYVPELPAQALLRLRPHLQGSPVAVLEGAPPQERVCAGNAQARRDGLVHGMTRVEAESFAGMTVLRRSVREEEAAQAALLGCAGSFTPLVETLHTETAAVCVLDVAGLARLHRDPHAFASALRQALLSRGLYASIAISANFHAACALAQGTRGMVVAVPGEEQKALAPLLLEVLRLGSDGLTDVQAQTLSLWGIRTLGGLAALPQKELIARMGQGGKRLRELARGEHPHLFAPVPVPWELREEFAFDAPVLLEAAILFVLSPMLDQLIHQARDRALAIATVTVTYTLEAESPILKDDSRSNLEESRVDLHPATPARRNDSKPGGPSDAGERQLRAIHLVSPSAHPPTRAKTDQTATGSAANTARAVPVGSKYQRTLRPTLPTLDKRLLLKLLQLDLAAHPPPAPVLVLVVEATAAKTGAVQGGLFAPPLPEPSRLDVTLARLAALVGEDRVGSPMLRDTHAPDSFSLRHYIVDSQSAGGAAGVHTEEARRIPAMRQLRPPEPVQVYTVANQPARVRFRGELFQVRSACGPWRMSGAWWGGDAWAYEYWDIVAERAASSPRSASALPGKDHESGSAAAGERPPLHPFLIQAPAPPQRLCCRLQLGRVFRSEGGEAGAQGLDQWCVDGLYD